MPNPTAEEPVDFGDAELFGVVLGRGSASLANTPSAIIVPTLRQRAGDPPPFISTRGIFIVIISYNATLYGLAKCH